MRTNAGRDFMALATADPSSDGTGSYAPACYMALTANATAPVATDTALAGEITSGALVRVRAAFAHTSGTNLFTLTQTFTSDQAITIAKVGIFNDPTAGVMLSETLLTEPIPLQPGWQVQLTVAVTL